MVHPKVVSPPALWWWCGCAEQAWAERTLQHAGGGRCSNRAQPHLCERGCVQALLHPTAFMQVACNCNMSSQAHQHTSSTRVHVARSSHGQPHAWMGQRTCIVKAGPSMRVSAPPYSPGPGPASCIFFGDGGVAREKGKEPESPGSSCAARYLHRGLLAALWQGVACGSLSCMHACAIHYYVVARRATGACLRVGRARQRRGKCRAGASTS